MKHIDLGLEYIKAEHLDYYIENEPQIFEKRVEESKIYKFLWPLPFLWGVIYFIILIIWVSTSNDKLELFLKIGHFPTLPSFALLYLYKKRQNTSVENKILSFFHYSIYKNKWIYYNASNPNVIFTFKMAYNWLNKNQIK